MTITDIDDKIEKKERERSTQKHTIKRGRRERRG